MNAAEKNTPKSLGRPGPKAEVGGEAGSVDRALLIPNGRLLRAEAGKLWIYGDELLFRRKGVMRRVARLSEIRRIERVHGDWLDLRHYYLHTSGGWFDLVPVRGGAELDPLAAAIARHAGAEVEERPVESVLLRHLNGAWDRGTLGKLLVGAEILAFITLIVYAYSRP